MLQKFKIIAGPCLAESKEVVEETAAVLTSIAKTFDVEYYYKASYRKANRTSVGSFEGVGDETALGWIASVGKSYGVPTLTDIHSVGDAEMACKYVDVLQIPAFLSRQTDLLLAAGQTGKAVNIKKGQFMAPEDIIKAAAKVSSTGNSNIWLTERGTFFGYHDLVVDFRSLITMKESNYITIYDATHSVQQPSIGAQSGGKREFIKLLARAAVSLGIDGVFFETHPNPSLAKSDAATQLPLSEAKDFINELLELNYFIKRGSA